MLEYNKGNIVELILFNLQIAFDKVRHSILLEKLKSIGIKDVTLWIKNKRSYFMD